MKTYLIDGNNVLRAEKNWDKLFKEDTERAKDLLVQKVIDFLRDRDNRAIIFLDGFNFVHSHQKVSKNVEVKYAKNKTADETILITIEKQKNKRNLIIVTNDIELKNKAKLNECQVMSSKDFIQKLDKTKFPSKNSEKPDPINDDINYWLNEFNRHD